MKEFDTWKFWLSSAVVFAGILAAGTVESWIEGDKPETTATSSYASPSPAAAAAVAASGSGRQ
jgi:hypothetical protein